MGNLSRIYRTEDDDGDKFYIEDFQHCLAFISEDSDSRTVQTDLISDDIVELIDVLTQWKLRHDKLMADKMGISPAQIRRIEAYKMEIKNG